MSGSQGVLATSVGMAVGTYLLATGTELALIRAFRPSEQELAWVSDVMLATAVGTLTYLWQHLRATRTALSVVERDKLVLDTQLGVAADVQRSLLPPLPPPGTRAEWAARLVPAGRVGGDFYDAVGLDDGVTVFILGDISGKGIPAAMLLAYTRAVFRTVAREVAEPATLMQRLSKALHRDTGGTPYVTCIVGCLTMDGALTYVNAGHPPGVVLREEGILSLEHGGPPAGLLPDAAYEQGMIALRPNDVVAIFTDGITEALDGPVPPMDQIRRCLVDQATSASASNVADALISLAVSGHGPAGVRNWQDDRTVLVLRVKA